MLKKPLATAAIAMLAAASLNAAPLNPKTVSSKAVWVAHVDVERLLASQLGGKFMGEANKEMKADLKIKALAEKYNLDLQRDIKGMTLYGMSVPIDGKVSGGVAICHLTFDSTKLLADLKALPGYKEIPHGKHIIIAVPTLDVQGNLQATSDGETGWCCFQKNMIMMGDTPEMVKTGLDVLAGKASGMALGKRGTAWLGKSVNSTLFIAADKLQEGGGGKDSAGVGTLKVETFRLVLDEVADADGNNLTGSMVMRATTLGAARQAQQMTQLLLAVGAMSLAGSSPASNDKSAMTPAVKKSLSQLLAGITATVADRDVKIEMSVPVASIMALADSGVKSIKQAIAEKAAAVPVEVPAATTAATTVQ